MFKAIHAVLVFFGMARPRNKQNKYEVLFGGAAAGHGEHGSLQGTWIKEGHKEPINISFYFKGMMLPPKMTEELIIELYRHARFVGIVPSHLYGYGGLAPARPPAIQRPQLDRNVRLSHSS